MITQSEKTKNSDLIKVTVTEIVERLTVFIDSVQSWIKTNWSKITQYIEGILISESTVYQSRCWSCHTPIKSVKREHKFVNWIGNKWLGNKKCENLGCNYFKCNKCGLCLCNSSYWRISSSSIKKRWEVEKKLSYVRRITSFFKGKKKQDLETIKF